MEATITLVLKELILPPGGIVLLGLAGLLCLWRSPAMGRVLLILTVLLSYLLSAPIVSRALASSLEVHPPVTSETNLGDFWQAIVVLGGGTDGVSPEYGREVLSARSLQRVRFAAELHKRTGLPLLLSGGVGRGANGQVAESKVMSEVLQNQFGVTPRWIEGESRNTAENAVYSRTVLAADKIDNVVLVTEAIHMRRAELSFGTQGFAVKPAPTVFRGSNRPLQWTDWLPSAKAFHISRDCLHEHIGYVWYLIRGI